MPVRNRLADLAPEIAAWRRDIHAHPELMFDTARTAAIVADKLRAFGCDEVVTGIARNGVVGVIRGQKTGSGRVLGLRADMDALPIEEATGAAHASTEPGKMHACGHDGHTAMLLGAAQYLCETRNFDGTAVVIFQPAEEGGGGGRVMIEEGVLERFGIQEVYGMHNWPGIAEGRFAIRPGGFFAAADQFDIRITGKGGHAAKPHEGVDACLVAGHVMVALQSVVARNVDPVAQAVLSVTGIDAGGGAYNVIPQTAVMRGTVRTMDEGVRELVRARLIHVAEATAAAFGAAAEVTYHTGYPVMINAEVETEHAAAAARRVSGQCDEAPLVMGAEDFAYMLQARPGAYILVGNGDTAPVHHPEYDFNDAAIAPGTSWWAEIAEGRMPLG
ncbi:amidohydrolase [Rhodobacteraceae bacterium WD3A24]|nr:amidohydrolase [Rhodobacteraceae bacterium WD3A24]